MFNVLSNYGMKLIQKGGAKAMTSDTGATFLTLFLVALLALVIRAWLVYVTYNAVAPKLSENVGGNAMTFRPLTMMESVLLVILIQNLFN